MLKISTYFLSGLMHVGCLAFVLWCPWQDNGSTSGVNSDQHRFIKAIHNIPELVLSEIEDAPIDEINPDRQDFEPLPDLATDAHEQELQDRPVIANQVPIEFKMPDFEFFYLSDLAGRLPEEKQEPVQAVTATEPNLVANVPVQKAAPELSSPNDESEDVKAVATHAPKPKYPIKANKRGWTGDVKIRIHVLASGLVGAVDVLESSGYNVLDTCAVDFIQENWIFSPAHKDGKNVAAFVEQLVKFELQ